MSTEQGDFRKIRRLESSNAFLQVLLLLAILLGMNYLAARFYTRTDLTRSNEHSLSLETRAYIEKIDPENPVRIIVTLLAKPNDTDEEIQTRLEVEKILREYAYHGNRQGTARIIVEYVDVFRQRERARELAMEYNIQQGDSILITSGERKRLIPASHLRALQERSGVLVGFRGEELFTSAILHVTRKEKDKVYILDGHGELLLDSADPERGMTEASAFLMKRNIELEPLNLLLARKVPADARLVIIASPQSEFSENEVILLKDYLRKRNGRVLVCLDPYFKHGLEDLFRDWGIDVQDKLVMEPSADRQAAQSGATLIREFANHQITRTIGASHIPVLMGACRPVQADLGAPLDESLRVTSILRTKEQSWAETDYRKLEKSLPGPRDIPGPISIAAVAERQIGQQGINIAGGRLTVFGDSNWISNAWFNRRGNRELLHNSVFWNLDRYTSLNIPPRPLKEYELTLDAEEFSSLRGRLLLLPLGILVLGGICIWSRRH